MKAELTVGDVDAASEHRDWHGYADRRAFRAEFDAAIRALRDGHCGGSAVGQWLIRSAVGSDQADLAAVFESGLNVSVHILAVIVVIELDREGAGCVIARAQNGRRCFEGARADVVGMMVLDSMEGDGMRDHAKADDGSAQQAVGKAHWCGVDGSEGKAKGVDGR